MDIPTRPTSCSLREMKIQRVLNIDIEFNKYTFCTMFDCLSVPERKNIQATIEAFEHAFDHPSNVQLIIKVLNLIPKIPSLDI